MSAMPRVQIYPVGKDDCLMPCMFKIQVTFENIEILTEWSSNRTRKQRVFLRLFNPEKRSLSKNLETSRLA